MNRRDFIKKMALGAGCAAMMSYRGFAASPSNKPNILFLFADDMCHEALGVLGSEVHTPNLDRLYSKGVSFSNTYNQGAWNGAVCVASRAMLNTGRFLWHANEVDKLLHENKKWDGKYWSQYMADAGYHTYMAGKWHVANDPTKLFQTTGHIRPGMANQTPEGYDRPKSPEDYEKGWKPWDEKYGGYWKGGKHWSEVLGDEGIGFIEQASKEDKPFFMYLAFNAPHDPRQSPQKFVDMYPLDKIKVPENFLPEYPYKDDIGCSETLRDEHLAPFPRTEYAVKVNRQEYYAIITHMDQQVGRILDALEKSGQQDNTYIFFTADHGLAVGHHGLIGKQNMYEHSVKPPMIVCGPDVPQGKQIDTPVYLQDIMPTTLELAGLDVPDEVEFKSLLPLINQTTRKHYPGIYGGYLDLQRMVRKGDDKIIYYPKIDKTLLFNLRNDPLEMNDLSGDPKNAPLIRKLKRTLKKLQKQIGDPLPIK